MATVIKVNYCKKCGQLERVASTLDLRHDQMVVQVWCPCCERDMRVTKLGRYDMYELDVEVKQEAAGDDDSDSGDVPAGGEAGGASDA
ncbi:MAG: hypothetical protein IKU38_08885 [Clostridia bacterium]|nr:hypothetical protein [Clostridia bacterium]